MKHYERTKPKTTKFAKKNSHKKSRQKFNQELRRAL